MVRIIIEIDGRQIAATTVDADRQPSAAAAHHTTQEGPMEAMARASVLGAESAGPAPDALVAPIGSISAADPGPFGGTWPETIAGAAGGIDAGAAPDFGPQPGENDPAQG